MEGTQEGTQEEQQAALDAFKAGFDGTETPPENDEHESDGAAPEYIQVTKQDWEDTKARLIEIDNLKTAHAKTSGSIGTLNQVIEQLKSQTKAGAPVELTDDIVDGLKSEFGDELSAAMLGVLKKAAPAMRGNGTAFDPIQIRKEAKAEAEATYSARRIAELQQELTEEHPDWATVRGTQEFKDWQASLKEDERTRLNTSNSVTYLSRKLSEFKDSQKKKQQTAVADAEKKRIAETKGNARRQAMQDAVQPKGDGGHAPAKTEVDDFHAGFYGKNGKK